MPILAAVLFAAQTGCGFTVVSDGTPPRVQGPVDIISRVQIGSQPDSPVAIERVDVSGVVLNVVPPSFNHDFSVDGTIAIDVKNVSNQPVRHLTVRLRSDVTPMIRETIRTLMLSVAPGETAQTTVAVHADGHFNSDIMLSLFVDSVQTSDCVYKPSQAWPLTR